MIVELGLWPSKYLINVAHSLPRSRFLNNIADSNEPTSIAVKMHRAFFDVSDKNSNTKLNSLNEPFSISRNLVQRKHEGNIMEINKMFDVRTKLNNDGIESIAPRATDINMEKFNHFTTANEGRKNQIEKFNNQDDAGNAQSFSNFFKSVFRCSASKVGNTKINEQIESDYPLNLHLRMNEIFSMHDKLSDIAENMNDLYSAGKAFVSRTFYFCGKELEEERVKPRLKLNLSFSFSFLFEMKQEKKLFAHLLWIFFRRNGDFYNGRLRDDGVRHFLTNESNFYSEPTLTF